MCCLHCWYVPGTNLVLIEEMNKYFSLNIIMSQLNVGLTDIRDFNFSAYKIIQWCSCLAMNIQEHRTIYCWIRYYIAHSDPNKLWNKCNYICVILNDRDMLWKKNQTERRLMANFDALKFSKCTADVVWFHRFASSIN